MVQSQFDSSKTQCSTVTLRSLLLGGVGTQHRLFGLVAHAHVLTPNLMHRFQAGHYSILVIALQTFI